jgi:protein MpaA
MLPSRPHEASAEPDCGDGTRTRRTVPSRYPRRRTVQLVGLLTLACASMAGCVPIQSPATATLAEPPLGPAVQPGNPGGQAVGAASVVPRRVELGRSVNGIPLTMDLFGNGPDSILIVGGIHGDEPSGAAVAGELARFLQARPELLVGRTVGILARANPDGLLSGTRANAHGVDLNRNFPSRKWRRACAGELPHGPAAASEPETLAVIKAIGIVQPNRIIDVHSIEHGYHCNNYDGAARHLAELLGSFNGYPVSADVGYPTPGALGCWAGVELNIPTITLELPRDLSCTECWQDNARALLAFINAADERAARSLALQAGSP